MEKLNTVSNKKGKLESGTDAGKKIGIITLYHDNFNYGGSLQAYALCRFLSLNGYQAEQISFLRTSATPSSSIKSRLKKLFSPQKVLKSIRFRMGRLRSRIMIRLFCSEIYKRNAEIAAFNQLQVNHSQRVYTPQSIEECNEYDVYITGSDQVWNPDWYFAAFFLDFVPVGKGKLSYAASLGHQTLTKDQLALFREKLSSFDAVSVREKDAMELLQPVSPVLVEWVLDPTLLLTQEQWDEVCSERLIQGNYVFAYFLGADENERCIAKAFAQKKGLPIITLPHLAGVFCTCDRTFGDQRLYSISPADFISLIKHAEYVLTDSFHGIVFSSLYQKEYYVFQRAGYSGMSSRIYSLTSLFGSGDHFCDTPEKASLTYIEHLSPINYSKSFSRFEEMRAHSKDFLKTNIDKLK